jgi:methionyl-tRNA formyltransferase
VLSVLLVAREGTGVQALRLVHRLGHDVAAVVTSAAPSDPVRRAAEELGAPLLDDRSVDWWPLAEQVRRQGIDLLLNVHSLAILPEELLSAPRVGSFNLHPGPLPRYAGLNAPSWAIFHGEAEHGVTLHWMTAEIDAGEIAYAAPVPIEERDTGLSLSLKCARAGLPLLETLLRAAADDPGSVPRVPQDRSRRRYFGRGAPQGGRVDWTRTAREVVDLVRASDFHPFASPWGSPSTRLQGREVAILRATRTREPCAAPPGTVDRIDGEGAWIAARDEWVRVGRVVLEGIPMETASALRPGNRLETGDAPAGPVPLPEAPASPA